MKKQKNGVPIPSYNWGLTRQQTIIEGPSLTKQSEARACDVNEIVRKYDRTGVITHLQSAQAVFADVSEVGSYLDAVQQVESAQEAFMDLPSGLRAHFANDPARFIDWSTTATQEEREDLYGEITGRNRITDARPEPTASPPADQPETGD